MFAAVYLKASYTLLITVNVKVKLRLLTALRMYTGLVHDCLRGSTHALMQNRIASVYLLLTTDYSECLGGCSPSHPSSTSGVTDYSECLLLSGFTDYSER